MGQSRSSGGGGLGLSTSLKSLINYWAAVPLERSLWSQASIPRLSANQPENRTSGRGIGLCWPGKTDSGPSSRAEGPAQEVHSPLGLGTSAQWNICDITANVMSTGNWWQLQLNYSLKDKEGPQRWPQKATRWPGPGEIELEMVPAWLA